jgi:hypothetical protein
MQSNEKKLIFTIDDDLHARFKIALRYDNLTQSTFIKYIIAAYLANNSHIRNLVDEVIIDRLNKRKIKMRNKDRQQESKTINDFALNDEEIESIFDMIESENPDL